MSHSHLQQSELPHVCCIVLLLAEWIICWVRTTVFCLVATAIQCCSIFYFWFQTLLGLCIYLSWRTIVFHLSEKIDDVYWFNIIYKITFKSKSEDGHFLCFFLFLILYVFCIFKSFSTVYLQKLMWPECAQKSHIALTSPTVNYSHHSFWNACVEHHMLFWWGLLRYMLFCDERCRTTCAFMLSISGMRRKTKRLCIHFLQAVTPAGAPLVSLLSAKHLFRATRTQYVNAKAY